MDYITLHYINESNGIKYQVWLLIWALQHQDHTLVSREIASTFL